MTKSILLFAMLSIGIFVDAQAQDLTFTFSNPSFLRGNAFNASWMMQEAQLQNQFTAPNEGFDFDDDPLEDFTEGLNRQILNQLSYQLFRNTFGEDEIREGKFDVGDYSINISEELEGVVIDITDITNGNETRVVVPYF